MYSKHIRRKGGGMGGRERGREGWDGGKEVREGWEGEED